MKKHHHILAHQSWLQASELQMLFDAVEAAGGELRVVGGAVRNALMKRDVSDIDCATTLLPEEMMRVASSCGLKVAPTGIKHGTVTVVINGTPFEVTTLRQDIETDGRHAVVQFGTDFVQDAMRRDFTINALYADKNGTVYDAVKGMQDIKTGVVRFIGDAEQRIYEDYLRALRYFRFFAWYGKGRPDADALKAITRCKAGLKELSVERVWVELKKLFAAPDPSRALLWMKQTGLLGIVLPENWGLDALPRSIKAEHALGLQPDAMLRLQSVLPLNGDKIGALTQRLKLSKTEQARFLEWVHFSGFESVPSDKILKQVAYWHGKQPTFDVLFHIFSKALEVEDSRAASFKQMLLGLRGWEKPVFPIKATALLDQGYQAGPELGQELKRLEKQWVEQDFKI
jgi:tRNA nucleotidyltransferase/poly(A) polymerase